MKTVQISYSELAAWHRSISTFIANHSWEDYIQPSSRLSEDLHLDGEDTYELLEKFSRKYNVDFNEFNGEEFILPESSCNPFTFIFLLLFLVIVSLKYLLLALSFLVAKRYYHRIAAFDTARFFNSFSKRNLKDLTVGDLITSAVIGKFTERKTVRFIRS